MPEISTTHAIIIPTYNTGGKVLETVRAALAEWSPIWVVVDGSTDGTGEQLEQLAATEPGLTVLQLPENRGKGAAVLRGLEALDEAGFTHALAMDADGQHATADIGSLMQASQESPACMVLGEPVFDASAPALRVNGRKISNWWANLETLWAGIHDSLFGFRVYPVQQLLGVMRATLFARRFDFDVEVVVRLAWRGVKPVNVRTPVRYLTKEEGGVSQFRYFRDNALLSWMHARLMVGFVVRLPMLVVRKMRKAGAFREQDA